MSREQWEIIRITIEKNIKKIVYKFFYTASHCIRRRPVQRYNYIIERLLKKKKHSNMRLAVNL